MVAEVHSTTKDEQILLVTRTIQATGERVFQAWTEVERFREWWGPRGSTFLGCKIDLRPNGVFHYGVRLSDGREIWAKWVFQKVEYPSRLVFISSSADAQGETIRHPLIATWPLETLSTVTLHSEGDRTELRLEGVPANASEAECVIFAALRQSMAHGWVGMLDQLETYLQR